jgi:hypothetical protein
MVTIATASYASPAGRRFVLQKGQHFRVAERIAPASDDGQQLRVRAEPFHPYQLTRRPSGSFRATRSVAIVRIVTQGFSPYCGAISARPMLMIPAL